MTVPSLFGAAATGLEFRPRPYQVEAREAVRSCWETHGHDGLAPLLVMATGCGKTLTALNICVRDVLDHGGRVVWLAHRKELLDQPLKDLRAFWPHIAGGVVQAGRDRVHADIVFASVDTLRSKKRISRLLASFDGGYPDLVVVDEAHHSPAPTHTKAIEALRGPETRLLGLTATPDREDGKDLSVLWEIAFTFGPTEAIEAGFLNAPWATVAKLDSFDESTVATSGNDYDEAELGKALLLAGIVQHTVEQLEAQHIAVKLPHRDAQSFMRARGRSTLVYCATVEQAQLTADALREAGWNARWVAGETPPADRDRLTRAFRAGKIEVLVNVATLTEGTDFPIASCVVLARPTRSWSLFCLDSETEVLTLAGWKTRWQVNVGDVVAAWDPDTEAIEWVRALAKVSRPLDPGEQWVTYRSPHLDIRVTSGHRMIWRCPKTVDQDWKVNTALDLAQRRTGFQIPVAGEQEGPGVPLTDHELAFVGWFMSDGSHNRGTGSIEITQASHQPQLADLRACLDGCGFKYGVAEKTGGTQFSETSPRLVFSVSKGAPRGSDTHLRGWGNLEPFLDKDLAPALEQATRHQLGVLLHAIHLGDGGKWRNESWTRRSYHVGTARKLMADRLQSLCVRRGYACNVAKARDRDFWTLHIKDITERHVGGQGQADRPRLSIEKPKAWHYRDHASWCIENELGTLITRRNGKVAIVGNCQILGRGMRLHGDQSDAFVLDLAGATDLHSIVSAPVLIGGSRCSDAPDGVHDFALLPTRAPRGACTHCNAAIACFPALKAGGEGRHDWVDLATPTPQGIERACRHCGSPQCAHSANGRHVWVDLEDEGVTVCVECDVEMPLRDGLSSLVGKRRTPVPEDIPWIRVFDPTSGNDLDREVWVASVPEQGLVIVVGDQAADSWRPYWLRKRRRSVRPLSGGPVSHADVTLRAADLLRRARRLAGNRRPTDGQHRYADTLGIDLSACQTAAEAEAEITRAKAFERVVALDLAVPTSRRAWTGKPGAWTRARSS